VQPINTVWVSLYDDTPGTEDCWRATASIFEDVGAVEDYWTGIITVVSPITIIFEDVRAALGLCV